MHPALTRYMGKEPTVCATCRRRAAGFGYSPRRITVSTVGLVTGIDKLGAERLGVNLAVSLHAARDDVRSRLMPINRSLNRCSVSGCRGVLIVTTPQTFTSDSTFG